MKYIFTFFLCVTLFPTTIVDAQETLFSNNFIGIKSGLGINPALKFVHEPYINSEGVITDYGVSSTPSYFFHSELTYARKIFPRFFVQTGLVYGYEAYNVRLNAGSDFIRTDEAIFPVEFTESDMEYRGLILRALYQHPINDKSGIFGSGGISITKYLRSKSQSLYQNTVDGEEEVIFFMLPDVGTSPVVNRRFTKFDLEVGYYHRLLNTLKVRASIAYSFSNKDAIPPSWFRFDGRRDMIIGEVSRKMSQPSLNLGFSYSFPQEKRELISSSTFFRETGTGLFGKRSLELKKNSMGYTYEFVHNAQMKIINQFVLDLNLNESDNGIFPAKNEIKNFTSLYYIRHLSPQSGIGAEFFTGKYRMQYDVVLDQGLRSATFLKQSLYFEKNSKTHILGLAIFYRHYFNLSNRSSIFISGGGGIVRTSTGFGSANSRGNRTFVPMQHLWERNIKQSSGMDNKPVVMFNTGYSYRLSERFSFNTSLFFRYSDLTTHESTSYYLLRNEFTDEETLLHEGEYSVKFRHYGLQLSLQYSFRNSTFDF